MEHDFDQIEQYLREPKVLPARSLSNSACIRLVQAAASVTNPPCSQLAGPADLAVLVRQVLLWENARRRQLANNPPIPRLSVPGFPPWPGREMWESVGVDVVSDGPNRWSVTATEWKPHWLAGAETQPPAEPLALPESRHREREVPGDPVLSAVNRTTYRCSGQRDAMRAILTTPAGSTLLVNLPTGTGKSLCAQLPAVTESHGLTIVIVPTTALCIDQEKAVHERLPTLGTCDLAYYSTTDGRRNRDIRHRIRHGQQRIVFTSPEALTGSLSGAVYAAVEAGHLRWLVVDEAHMVEAWGDEFRPAFQELAGLRRDLIRLDPRKEKFRTLLLSATVTQSVLRTLQTLFGDPGPFDMAASVQLRPEVAYWRAFSTENQQRERVLDAVLYLPRPAILYTTRVEAADEWGRILREAGFKRLDVVTGKTSAAEREHVLGRWRNGETDLVVGTSAFGLGVDQHDVRAVIHACVPENLDRFYQEVGRGGRDGNACMSLVIDTARDMKEAAGINGRAIISVDLGLPRWTEMFHQKQRLDGDRYRVPLSAAATFGMRGDYHESWNARLLNLLARSGLIALDYERPAMPSGPPDPAHDRIDSSVDDDPKAHTRTRVIRILDPGHLERVVWDAKVEPCRAETARSTREHFDLLRSAMNCRDGCISNTLATMYAIPGKAVVSAACGGCKHCRECGDEPWSTEMPLIRPCWPGPAVPGSGLVERLNGGNALAIFYTSTSLASWKQRILPVVRWLITQGVRNVVLPLSCREDWAAALSGNHRPVMLYSYEDFDPFVLARAGTLILHPPHAVLPLGVHMPTASDDHRVVLLPEGIADPSAPHRLLRDMLHCPTTTFDQLARDLGL